MSKGLTRWVWFVYAVAIAVAAAAMSSIPWWTVDDAFISYRYGYNLYAHGELTWNVLDGWWTDAGTIESLLAANQLVAQTGANRMEF